MKAKTIATLVLTLCIIAGVTAMTSAMALTPTTLTIKAEGLDLSGKVKSSKSKCKGDRKVTVFKQKAGSQNPSTDQKIGSDTSADNGEWSTGNSGISGKVYARVGKGNGCKGDRSPTIRASNNP